MPLVSETRIEEYDWMNGPCRHLYFHVPFCSGKCSYCAFYSVPYEEKLADRYMDALEREASMRHGEERCETIYVGGGTPSVLSPAQWDRLLGIVASMGGKGAREWTVEVNPGTLTTGGIRRMAQAGVNRISMGVQSFDDGVLKALQRRHGGGAVAETFDIVRTAGITNVGLDLIAGLPGVDADDWRRTLVRAVALVPTHLSVYALGLEPGTRLHRQAACGEVCVPGDEAVLDALNVAAELLQSQGYVRYEISNYARPGGECLHNLACWRGDDYVGLGPAAASRLARERWTNAPDLPSYCAALESGHPPPREQETLDDPTDLVERLLFQFRLSEGVAVEAWCRHHGPTGTALWERWQPELMRLEREGMLARNGDRWVATARGCEVLDAVLDRLMV